jgi:arylformamidase
MTIDYDREYNTRAYAPDHLEVLDRIARGAAAYRAKATAEQRAELDIRYGSTPRQIVDIFYSNAGKDAPLAVYIHGGFWRALQPSAFSEVAAGLNARGVTVTLPGYDLAPQVGIGDIVEQMRAALVFLHKKFGKRMLVLGHSAGGHLAACMIATDWTKLGAPADLVPAGMGISGLYDLAPLVHTAMNADWKLTDAEAKRLSPLLMPAPKGKTFDCVVGGIESAEFLRQSRELAEVWGKAGVATRYDAPAGIHHFTVIEPLTDGDSGMVNRLLELLPRN